MYTARIQNANKKEITLNNQESEFQILQIRGLSQPQAQINTTNIAGLDGARLNSAKLATRNIVITIRLNGDVEKNRHLLYSYFRTKEPCTFFYKNGTLDVSIDGIVETVDCDLFSRSELMQISIICPFPYFSSIAAVIFDISNETGGFYFPFSIDYDDPIPISTYEQGRVTNVFNSQSETGVIIRIIAKNAFSSIRIQNVVTGEYVALNYAFQAGDIITVDTNKGQKGVSLLRAGATTNIFTSLQKGSTFFQLAMGDNEFAYQVDSGRGDNFVNIEFRFNNLYRGV